jgi:hypothetical protein
MAKFTFYEQEAIFAQEEYMELIQSVEGFSSITNKQFEKIKPKLEKAASILHHEAQKLNEKKFKIKKGGLRTVMSGVEEFHMTKNPEKTYMGISVVIYNVRSIILEKLPKIKDVPLTKQRKTIQKIVLNKISKRFKWVFKQKLLALLIPLPISIGMALAKKNYKMYDEYDIEKGEGKLWIYYGKPINPNVSNKNNKDDDKNPDDVDMAETKQKENKI